MTQPTFAGVEMGGTSVLVAISDPSSPTSVKESVRIPTTTPDETFGKILDWLRTKKFDSIGIACFGPVELDVNSPNYGSITTTPKPNWANVPVTSRFKEFNCPVGFDTDVNAAAVGHFRYGLQEKTNKTKGGMGCCYITVGTGVGVGVVVNGQAIHGLLHPEAGHIFVPRKDGDTFEGICPYHKSCVEGLCASGAVAKRKQITASEIPSVPDDDPIWDFFSFYIAQLCNTLTLIVSPHEIVLGGGLMQRSSLFPRIRKHAAQLVNGYINSPTDLDKHIVPSPFGSNAGIVGAFAMAQNAYANSRS